MRKVLFRHLVAVAFAFFPTFAISQSVTIAEKLKRIDVQHERLGAVQAEILSTQQILAKMQSQASNTEFNILQSAISDLASAQRELFFLRELLALQLMIKEEGRVFIAGSIQSHRNFIQKSYTSAAERSKVLRVTIEKSLSLEVRDNLKSAESELRNTADLAKLPM